MTLGRIQTILKNGRSTKPTEASDSHLLQQIAACFMTITLFLLPPVLPSCLFRFLPNAESRGRGSRRGIAAPLPPLPQDFSPPLVLCVEAKPMAKPSWGRAMGGQTHMRDYLRITKPFHCIAAGRVSDLSCGGPWGPRIDQKCMIDNTPYMKDYDPVASLPY